MAPHLRMLRCVGVLERLAGCLMYIKEAMYISRTSASVAPVPHLRLLRWGACPCVSHTLVSCDGHTPWYPYYHSVHKHYKTEFRYIPLLCRVMATPVTHLRTLMTSAICNRIPVHVVGKLSIPFSLNHSPHKGPYPITIYYHITVLKT